MKFKYYFGRYSGHVAIQLKPNTNGFGIRYMRASKGLFGIRIKDNYSWILYIGCWWTWAFETMIMNSNFFSNK